MSERIEEETVEKSECINEQHLDVPCHLCCEITHVFRVDDKESPKKITVGERVCMIKKYKLFHRNKDGTVVQFVGNAYCEKCRNGGVLTCPYCNKIIRIEIARKKDV